MILRLAYAIRAALAAFYRQPTPEEEQEALQDIRTW